VATDVVQFGLGMLGSIVLAWILVREAGGIGAMTANIQAHYGQWVLDTGVRQSDRLLGFLPPSGALLMPFLLLMSMQWLFQINADGTGYLAQRSMACENEREARRAGVLFAWLQILLRTLPWLLIGVAL